MAIVSGTLVMALLIVVFIWTQESKKRESWLDQQYEKYHGKGHD